MMAQTSSIDRFDGERVDERKAWAVWHDGTIVALPLADIRRVADHQHWADVEVEVLPAWRHNALATALLARAVKVWQVETETARNYLNHRFVRVDTARALSP